MNKNGGRMYYVLSFATWLATVMVVSFTIVPIMIIFFFGIPFSRKLKEANVLKTNAPIKSELISVLILSLLFTIYSWLIISLTPYDFAYWAALVVIIFFSLGKVGANGSNVADYMATNEKYIDKKKYEELVK